ncbi:LOW QUALITY PROTEIN: uncharacterized protein PRCAT00004639001 [Priceomyces carsonii]|uniref:uncharacterized protein n=1 Tax=Priceomyces carsonii TaxID=28549 RepID=UPI002ED88522|nr:unnamed protein product [Priceomyces carsonii]
MINLYKTFRSNSIDWKIKNVSYLTAKNGFTTNNLATDSHISGPFNQDLIEISISTFNTKDLLKTEHVLTKRLTNKNSRGGSILKALTIILYLIQNGSEQFVAWVLNSKYLIKSLGHQDFDLKFMKLISDRVASILNYCENPVEMEHLRNNIYKLRNEMSTPGLKRSNSIEATRDNLKVERKVKSLDIQRFEEPKFDKLTALVEESTEDFMTNDDLKYTNNPFFSMI